MVSNFSACDGFAAVPVGFTDRFTDGFVGNTITRAITNTITTVTVTAAAAAARLFSFFVILVLAATVLEQRDPSHPAEERIAVLHRFEAHQTKDLRRGIPLVERERRGVFLETINSSSIATYNSYIWYNIRVKSL